MIAPPGGAALARPGCVLSRVRAEGHDRAAGRRGLGPTGLRIGRALALAHRRARRLRPRPLKASAASAANRAAGGGAAGPGGGRGYRLPTILDIRTLFRQVPCGYLDVKQKVIQCTMFG